jgi:hypothetical protein
MDSLVSTPATPASFPGRAREGYNFGERYWASLTRTCLPPRDRSGTNTVHGETSATGTRIIARPEAGRGTGWQEEHHPSTRLSDPEFIRRLDREARREHLRSPRRWRIPAIVTVMGVTVAASLLVFSLGGPNKPGAAPSATQAANTTAGPTPASPAPSPAGGHPAERATITGIPSGASGFLPGEIVPLSGEIQNIPPRHHLWLFVRYRNSPNFFPADQEVKVLDGHWTGSITIRKPGTSEVILADLAPEAYEEVQSNATSQVEGFLILPGVYFLVRMEITATL